MYWVCVSGGAGYVMYVCVRCVWCGGGIRCVCGVIYMWCVYMYVWCWYMSSVVWGVGMCVA